MRNENELQVELRQVDYVRAPNGARLQASAIDGIFAAALSQFATVLLLSVTKTDLELLATVVVTVLYYAYPLTVNGQTIGKKIYGLRVLPYEEDRALNFKEALIRETVGKTISYTTMFAGFFMILWRDDRRGLHDLISKTAVVQDGAVAERQKNFIFSFAKSCAVSTFLTLATLSYFYYSSFFADRIEAQLTSQGLKVRDVSGSLAKGFKISGYEHTNESGTIHFGDVSFKFSDYSKMLSEKTLTLSSVSITNAEMKTTSVSGDMLLMGFLVAPFLGTQAAVEEHEPQPDQSTRKKFQFETIRVKNFIASNAKIIDPKKTTDIRLVEFTDFAIDPLTKKVSWTKLNVQTSVFDLQTNKVSFHKGDLELSSAIAAKVHQLPGVNLKQPLDLIATFAIAKGQLLSLQINALKNTLTLTGGTQSNYQIWVTALAPSDYIDGIPFDKISFYNSKSSPFELVSASPQAATFQIGSSQFVYQPQKLTSGDPSSMFAPMLNSRVEAFHQTAEDLYTLRMPPGFIPTLILGGGKIELSSNKGLPTEEILYRLGAKNPLAMAKFFVSPPRVPASSPYGR